MRLAKWLLLLVLYALNAPFAKAEAQLRVQTAGCNAQKMATAILSWSADPNAPGDAAGYQIRTNSPTGSVVGNVGSSGTLTTGAWVGDGKLFFLIKRATGEVIGRARALVDFPSCYTPLTFDLDTRPLCSGSSFISGRMTWDVRPLIGNRALKLYVGKTNGDGSEKLFGNVSSHGSTTTGTWIGPTTEFIVRDAATGDVVYRNVPHPNTAKECPNIHFALQAKGFVDCGFTNKGSAILEWDTSAAHYDAVSIYVNAPSGGGENWRLMGNGSAKGHVDFGNWLRNGYRLWLKDRHTGMELAYMVVKPNSAACPSLIQVGLPAHVLARGAMEPFEQLALTSSQSMDGINFFVQTDTGGRTPLDILSRTANKVYVRVPPAFSVYGSQLLFQSRSAVIVGTKGGTANAPHIAAASPALSIWYPTVQIPASIAPGTITKIWLERLQVAFGNAKTYQQAFAQAATGLPAVDAAAFDRGTLASSELLNAVERIRSGQTDAVQIGTARGGQPIMLDANVLYYLDAILLQTMESYVPSSMKSVSKAAYAANAQAKGAGQDPVDSFVDEWRELVNSRLPEDVLAMSRRMRVAIGAGSAVGTLIYAGTATAEVILVAGAVGTMTSLLAPAAVALAIEGGGSYILDGHTDLGDFRTTLRFASDAFMQMASSVLNEALTDKFALSERLSVLSGALVDELLDFSAGTASKPGLVEYLGNLPASFHDKFVQVANALGIENESWPDGQGRLTFVFAELDGLDSADQAIIDTYGHAGDDGVPSFGEYCNPEFPWFDDKPKKDYSGYPSLPYSVNDLSAGVVALGLPVITWEDGDFYQHYVPYTCRVSDPNGGDHDIAVTGSYTATLEIGDGPYAGTKNSISYDYGSPRASEAWPVDVSTSSIYAEKEQCKDGSFAVIHGSSEHIYRVGRSVFPIDAHGTDDARTIIKSLMAPSGMAPSGCDSISIGWF